MRRLIFNDINKNLRQFIGTIIAVMVSVAIIVSCLNLSLAAKALDDFGHRFDSVDAVIKHDSKIEIEYWDDDEIETEDESVDGTIFLNETQVNNLISQYGGIADYTFFTKIDEYNQSKFSGHNVSSMDFSNFNLVSGSLPQENEVLVDQDLITKLNKEIGDTLRIKTINGYNNYEISGVVTSNIEDIYGLQNYIFFNDQTAKENSLGANGVALNTNDIDSLKDSLKNTEYKLYYGNNINHAEIESVIFQNMGLFVIFITMGSICLVISMFVISGTIQFSIKNRIRHFALLRIIGFTKRKVNHIVVSQTTIIAIIGGIFGTVLSDFVTDGIIQAYNYMGLVSETFTAPMIPIMSLLTVGGVLLLTLLVALGTANKTLSLPPVKAFKQIDTAESNYSAGRIITGFIFLAGGISILVFTPFTAGVGVGMGFLFVSVSIIGLMSLSPILMMFINWLLSIFTKGMHDRLGQVASANVKNKASKFAIAALSITIIIAINGIMLLNNITFINTTAQNSYEYAEEYEYMLTTDLEGDLESIEYFGTLSTSVIIKRTPEKLDEWNVLGVNIMPSNINVTQGQPIANVNEVVIPDTNNKYDIGQTLDIWTENGIPSTVTIVGKYEDMGMSESFTAIMHSQSIIENSYSGEYRLLYSNTEINGSVLNNADLYRNNPSFDIQMAALVLMTIISVLLSVIAIFNTFSIIMSVRKEEFNGLKIIGATKSQIINMTIIETIIVVLTGIIMGALLLILGVGKYSMINTGVYNFIVEGKYFWGLIVFAGLIGLVAGFIPSVNTIRKLKRQYRV